MTPTDLLSYISVSQVHILTSSCTHMYTQTHGTYKPYYTSVQPPQTQGYVHTENWQTLTPTPAIH